MSYPEPQNIGSKYKNKNKPMLISRIHREESSDSKNDSPQQSLQDSQAAQSEVWITIVQEEKEMIVPQEVLHYKHIRYFTDFYWSPPVCHALGWAERALGIWMAATNF